MSDVNERSFAPGTEADGANAGNTKPWHERIRVPVWRFKPASPPVKVARVLKTRIIPKIFLALRPAHPSDSPAADQEPSSIQNFAALVLGHDDSAALVYVEALRAQGAMVEAIFLDLLAPTARHLGLLWETDETDFASVTLAVGRLQSILRQLGDAFIREAGQSESGETALLTVIPGEQHSFGLSMVAEFFRRAGWNLCTGPFTSQRELTALAQNHWFDVVGFSVSSDRRLNELKRGIEEIRRDSRNQNVGIILGGPMMIAHPELVAAVGADMMSGDATTAPREAHELIERISGRSRDRQRGE